ncbi:hypothetical protein HYU07_01085 [Candidatus Woesearchaeota archaeon]|nr:hypothetical protein [Candidatus Woesearchaeota archaeon]
MADAKLVKYIKEQLKRGYTADQVKSYLLNYGYNINSVNEAIDQAASRKANFMPLLIIISVLIVIGLAAYFLITTLEKKPISEQPGYIPPTQPTIPTTQPTTTTQTTTPIIPPTKPTTLPTTTPTTQPPATPTPKPTPGITIEKIKEMAKRSPDDAADNCIKLEDSRDIDDCYKAVAETANSSVYCRKIAKVFSKDSCYVTFILIGDYSMCGDITDSYYKNSCETLKKLELTQQLIAENRTSEVAEMYNITITASKSKLDRIIDYVNEGKTNEQIATTLNDELTPSYNNVLNTIRNAVAEGKTKDEIKTMIEGG